MLLLRLGVTNIVLSKLILLVIAALPLLDISGNQRAAYATGLIVAMPVLFWSGMALVGRESWLVARHRSLRVVPRELWRLFRYGPSLETVDAVGERPESAPEVTAV